MHVKSFKVNDIHRQPYMHQVMQILDRNFDEKNVILGTAKVTYMYNLDPMFFGMYF